MIWMLIAQLRRLRFLVATLIAVLYAFGVLGPALAFSVEKNVSIVHSLMEAHGGEIVLHIHHDDTDHEASSKPRPHVGHHCCGVFALAALVGPVTVFSIPSVFCKPLLTDKAPARRQIEW